MFELFIFVFLLACSAFFSGSETIITALNEINVLAALKGGKGSRIQNLILWMCKNKPTVIGAVLIGNNIVNTVLAVYAGVITDKVLSSNNFISPNLAPVIASVVTIIFLLIFGEVIPKQIGVSFSKRLAPLVAYPVYWIVTLLKPLTFTMDKLSRLVMLALPIKQETNNAPTIQEMLTLAKFSEKAGHIDSIERKLMARSSKFNDICAGDVMVPRNMVTAIAIDSSIKKVLEVFSEHMYTRVPVYKTNIDEIVGVFNFKEILRFSPEERNNFNIAKKMLLPLYVPENVVIGELLERMRENCSHMAIVIDEYATMLGIVTMEDIVERVFGVINDEYDEAEPEPEASKNGELYVDGHISLQDLSELLCLEFPVKVTRKVNTLNGFLTYLKGDFPREREKITFEGYVFFIKSTIGYRVDKIVITKESKQVKATVKA